MKGRLDFSFRHAGEAMAWAYLESRQHTLLRHNYHTGYAEIDLITIDPFCTLHCIEVKSWKSKSLVHPLESMKPHKMELYKKCMMQFIVELANDPDCLALIKEKNCETSISKLSISFDLIWNQADHIEYFTQLG